MGAFYYDIEDNRGHPRNTIIMRVVMDEPTGELTPHYPFEHFDKEVAY
jgi:hypothetical protein